MSEIGNNHQVEDSFHSGNYQKDSFAGKILELKYFIRNKPALDNFLGLRSKLIEVISKIKRELGFEKVFCRFYFGSFEPDKKMQKKLAKFQIGIFDLISVQMFNDRFDDFKEIFEYANNLSKGKVIPLNDLLLETELTIQILNYLVDMNPMYSRWIYHKVKAKGTCLENCSRIPKTLKEAGIKSIVVNCSKRCGIDYKECKNLSASIVLRTIFNFDYCCKDFRQVVKDVNGKKIGFPSEGMDKFDTNTGEWIKVQNRNYRISRMNDFFNIHNFDTSIGGIQDKPKIKILIKYLNP